jgi:hypothetical protein
MENKQNEVGQLQFENFRKVEKSNILNISSQKKNMPCAVSRVNK